MKTTEQFEADVLERMNFVKSAKISHFRELHLIHMKAEAERIAGEKLLAKKMDAVREKTARQLISDAAKRENAEKALQEARAKTLELAEARHIYEVKM